MNVIKKLITGLLFATSSVCAMQLPENNAIEASQGYRYRHTKFYENGEAHYKFSCVNKASQQIDGYIVYNLHNEKTGLWEVSKLVASVRKKRDSHGLT